jgi:acetylornithine deacetylase/succinyl-diaminopimelate desuccinylase-like protein
MAPVRPRKPRMIASKPFPRTIIGQVRRHARGARFRTYLRELLLELCRIDTTPSPDVGRMQLAERACFEILERELRSLDFSGEIQRRPINPEIQAHPAYSLLHFTRTPARPQGLTAEQTYAGRSNLVYTIRGAGQGRGRSVALNAHLDVVAPFLPIRAANGIIFGRGACDDKGPVVAMVGALKVLSRVMASANLKWNRNVLGMFVVEEETGGNGSLSLAIDRDLKRLYDTVLVSECTGLKVYPANRGAVWYRAELSAAPDASLLELAAYVIEQMEQEGAALRAESRHPLFPQRPVQTCHGRVGGFGEHPSRVCGQVSFLIRVGGRPSSQLEMLTRDCLEAGLGRYIGLYGDKTKVPDPATGKPMVGRHYDLLRTAEGFRVDVHGAPGHMGAIRERDGAITKMAFLILGLARSKERLRLEAGGRFELKLAEDRDAGAQSTLVLEGGQGFIPTHSIEEVMDRLRRAAERGAESYIRQIGGKESGAELVSVSYEKLHNAAFDGDPDSASMRNAIAAARDCGLWKEEPVVGWTVSCDARLFASEYPRMAVLTFGPGQLAYAHSDQEQIALKEICAAIEFLCLFLLRETGTVPESK